jgi:hypothetical protein
MTMPANAMKAILIDFLVAAATAAAAASAAGECRGFCGAAVGGAVSGAENRQLDGVFLAGATWASDFLSFIEDDFFEVGLAIVADVFVDGHPGTP